MEERRESLHHELVAPAPTLLHLEDPYTSLCTLKGFRETNLHSKFPPLKFIVLASQSCSSLAAEAPRVLEVVAVGSSRGNPPAQPGHRSAVEGLGSDVGRRQEESRGGNVGRRGRVGWRRGYFPSRAKSRFSPQLLKMHT